MLRINKDLESNTIIVTVSEAVKTSNPVFAMILKSDFTKREIQIDLGVNKSRFKSRYDMFILESGSYSDLETGIYTYSITADGEIAEQGILKVTSPNSSNLPIALPNQGQSTIKVLKIKD